MRTETCYDVIVLGGGPAGLSSAWRLAEKGASVLLLEKERIGSTKKAWLTFDYVLKKYRLEDCIRNRFSRISFRSYLGSRYDFRDPSFVRPIHEDRALRILAERAASHGAEIRDGERFLDYRTDRSTGTMVVRTSRTSYRARLGIDAMGRASPILSSRGRPNRVTDQGCLAFVLEGVRHKNDNTLFLYDFFDSGDEDFWLAPLEDDKVLVGTVSFKALTRRTLAAKAARLGEYIRAQNLHGRITDVRLGNIPFGPQSRVSTDMFLCLGDSGNTPLPSSGFSFSRCLEESAIAADFALKVLTREARIGGYKRALRRAKSPGFHYHLLVSELSQCLPDSLWDRALDALSDVDEEYVTNLFTGRDLGFRFLGQALKASFRMYAPHQMVRLAGLFVRERIPALWRPPTGASSLADGLSQAEVFPEVVAAAEASAKTMRAAAGTS